MYTLSGLSIEQLKKDAKKYKKKYKISLHEAQNHISLKSENMIWSKMQKSSKVEGGILSFLKFYTIDKKKEMIPVFHNKFINIVYAPPGFGKSTLINEILKHSSYKNIIYTSVFGRACMSKISSSVSNDKNIEFIELNEKYRSNKDMINILKDIVKKINSGVDCLVFDEFMRFDLNEKTIKKLFYDICILSKKFKVSIIIGTQVLDENLFFMKDHINSLLTSSYYKYDNYKKMEVLTGVSLDIMDTSISKNGIKGLIVLNSVINTQITTSMQLYHP